MLACVAVVMFGAVGAAAANAAAVAPPAAAAAVTAVMVPPPPPQPAEDEKLQYGMFMALQYYAPARPMSTWAVIGRAAQKLAPAPLYVSVCCDHGEGGWVTRLTPICRTNSSDGAAVRAGLAIARQAGAHILHYTHTRLAYWPNASGQPNGTEMHCCQCCEREEYVAERVHQEVSAFPDDGIFTDNVIASWNWLDYYKSIVGAARTTERNRSVGFNLNCARDEPGNPQCTPVCHQAGHSTAECANCRSPRCSNLTQDFFDLADVHIMSETFARVIHDPKAYETNMPAVHLSNRNRNKMSMFTYNATPEQWRPLIDLAKSRGYTKFWVQGTGHDAVKHLPSFFEEMVDYISSLNRQETSEDDQILSPAARVAKM
jgi:hypothetical protein